MMDMLESKQFADKGRGLTARKAIPAGNRLAEEDASIVVIDAVHRDSHCSHCCQPANQLKQCSACHQIKYCSRKCQKTDWSTHKAECKSFDQV